MKDVFISDSIVYVGVDDKNIDLFESQYVVPNGVSYNSYVILDDKITIMDTVDRRGTEGWLANLKKTLGDKKPYYVVVSHLEPDHAGNLKTLLDLYPDIKVIGNPKTFTMIAQFFDVDLSDDRKVVVGEGDTVNLGTHTLQFFMAPLVHWPEVMVAYEQSEKILFSADGFGKFGAMGKRSKTLFYQHRWQIRRTGSESSEKGCHSGYPDDLPTARSNPERKPWLLHRQISNLEQLRTGRKGRCDRMCFHSRKYHDRCKETGGDPESKRREKCGSL